MLESARKKRASEVVILKSFYQSFHNANNPGAPVIADSGMDIAPAKSNRVVDAPPTKSLEVWTRSFQGLIKISAILRQRRMDKSGDKK